MPNRTLAPIRHARLMPAFGFTTPPRMRQSLLLILVWVALFAVVCGLCLIALDDLLAGVGVGSIVMAGMAPVSRAFLS